MPKNVQADLNADNTATTTKKEREKKSLIKNPEARPKSECQKIRSKCESDKP